MAMPVNDGTLQIGTPTLTISTKAYICESFNVNVKSWQVERLNASGVPDGRYVGQDTTEGTATLLFSSAVGFDLPAVGDTFTYTLDSVSTTFIITEVGSTEGQRDMKKCSITFTKQLN